MHGTCIPCLVEHIDKETSLHTPGVHGINSNEIRSVVLSEQIGIFSDIEDIYALLSICLIILGVAKAYSCWSDITVSHDSEPYKC